MADQHELTRLFENCEYNKLRFSKAFREFEEIQEKLFVIHEKEMAALMRRIQVGNDTVKLPNYKRRKTQLKNRRKVCLAIHRNALDAYGRDLQRIAEIFEFIESHGEEWKNGEQNKDE